MQQQNLVPDQLSFLQSIRYSIFPGSFNTKTNREKYRGFFRTLILHFRPRTVPERTLQLTLTWGLGGMAVVLVCVLFGTGLMLKFVYQPMPGNAYDSIIHLKN